MQPLAVRILLVEDSPSDAVLLQESLAELPLSHFEVTHVDSWAAASTCLSRERFDVLLLDLSLPDSTGRQTFVRARQTAPQLPIVVLTGMADEAIALDAMRQGVQDYLVKGQTDGQQTARAIRYAIERGRVEAALQEARTALQAVNEDLEHRVAARTTQLQELVGELEHFSYSIIHDLRAPLRAMRGLADLANESCAQCPKPDPRECLRRITVATDRMDHLITDALTYNQAVRQELPLTPVDVQALLRGMLDTYPELQPARAHIRLESDLPWVLGNQAGLTQCFSNLLDNAVKFVAPGRTPEIRIRAEPREGWVRLWIEDNGIGIPKAMLPRVFHMFARGHGSQRYAGTGIGLALVRKVVDRMGGRVGVESEEGQGSRFWVELRLQSKTSER